jgi:hypothetical protein
MTCAAKGSESANIHIDIDEKERVTIIATIDAAGTQMPLKIVGKDKTKKSLARFRLRRDVWARFSESGWTTPGVMVNYLTRSRQNRSQDGLVLLTVDTHSANRSAEARATDGQLAIDLIFI